MLFNSIEFIVFFPIVCLLHFAVPARYRWLLLLTASYIFYASWNPYYLLLIWCSTLIDYATGRLLSVVRSRNRRLLLLGLSLIMNLSILGVFKYFDFVTENIQSLCAFLGFAFTPPDWDVLLPVGISFYTFQTLSYTIDVFRNDAKPERHMGRFALYVAFFPQLVAGPIERASRLLPQLSRDVSPDATRIVSGMRLILWGMFKKVVIADRLALFVNAVYDNPEATPGPLLVAATVFFAYQIYCDFSGYSDIAIGCARVMGYDLMINFNRPYHARSISDFWRRWHISLSTWFRDYLFIPLGGSRVRIPLRYLNILIVFTVSGLWHGASWTFVVWGLLHGLYYVFSATTEPLRRMVTRATRIEAAPRLWSAAQIACTFTLVCVGWVFFRSQDWTHAMEVFRGSGTGWSEFFHTPGASFMFGGTYTHLTDIAAGLGLIALLEILETYQRTGEAPTFLASQRISLRWTVYLCLLLAIANWGVFDEIPFIYFQF